MAHNSYSRTTPIGTVIGMTPVLLINTDQARTGFLIQNSSSSPIKFGLCPPTDVGSIIHTLYPGHEWTMEDAFTYYGPISVMGTTSGQLVTGDYGTA